METAQPAHTIIYHHNTCSMWLPETLLAYSNMIFLFKVEVQCWMDKKTTLKAVSFKAVVVFASDIHNL